MTDQEQALDLPGWIMLGLIVAFYPAFILFSYTTWFFDEFRYAVAPPTVMFLGIFVSITFKRGFKKKFFALGDVFYYSVFAGLVGIISLAASESSTISNALTVRHKGMAEETLPKLKIELPKAVMAIEDLRAEFEKFDSQVVDECIDVLSNYDDDRISLPKQCLEIKQLNEELSLLAGRKKKIEDGIEVLEFVLAEPESDMVSTWLQDNFGDNRFLILQLFPCLLLCAISHKINKSIFTLFSGG